MNSWIGREVFFKQNVCEWERERESGEIGN